MSGAQLYGVVLAGGRSRRMQRDKAVLAYAGQSQLARAVALLEPLVARAFVSVRADQRSEPQRRRYPLIVDQLPDLGPIGGIHAALRTHPDRAWLVIACDLPFLTAPALQHLIGQRRPAQVATAYRSEYDGEPEPLCAIYEPASLAGIDAWIARGERCPRAFLAQADAQLLEPVAGRALDNINTSDEYLAAQAALEAGAPAAHGRRAQVPQEQQQRPRHLSVHYFALLREQAGRSTEALESPAATPRELYEELRARHGLQLAPELLRVAINEEFSDWNRPLNEGDRVAFLPPVAGG